MSSASAQWIEESLAHLESLEAAREEHEAALETTVDADMLRHHTTELERIDGEIRGLYAALEAVAEDGEGEEDSANTTRGYATEQEIEDYDPFAPPPSVAAAPSETPEAPAQAPAFVAEEFTSYDTTDVDEKKGGGLKWAVIGVAALGLVVGGAVMAGGGQKEEAAPAPTGAATVINAAPVGADTQGPKGAQGADVAVTPGQEIKKSSRSSSRRSSGRRGGGSKSRSRKDPSGVGKDGKISIKKTKDPLGGL